MPFNLSVIAGPHTGQQVHIGEGQVVRLGRTTRADYAFPADTYLSGAHLEVACVGGECRVKDLGSANGTFVNGAQITESLVRDGDQLAAGETTFVVQFTEAEAAGPGAPALPVVAQAANAPNPPPERTARMYVADYLPQERASTLQLTQEQRRAHEILMDQTAPLFAVLDAARDASVLRLIESSPLNGHPLFDNAEGGQPAAHVPYLVELGQTRSAADRARARVFLESVLHFGWEQNWGIFVTSLSHFEEIRAHFRRLLLVNAEGQRPLPFRFYDLRVLPALLPVCEPEEINAIFGPVISYLMESEQPDVMRIFSRGSQGLTTTTFHLAEVSAQARAGV